MSPYYLKEGESFKRWKGEEEELLDEKGKKTGVSVHCADNSDTEILVSIEVPYNGNFANRLVAGEKGTSLSNVSKPKVFREEGFRVTSWTPVLGSEELAQVIYSKEPIK